jgi:ubiquinone/menaquinone biosynthesis C-methylase UbiE
MNKNWFFKKRVPEPRTMGTIENKVFEQMSIDNYRTWIIPLADDIEGYVDKKVDKILDVGSGPGFLVREIALRFKKTTVIGLDNSAIAIKLAEKNCKNYKNIKFIKANASKIPFKDNSFDIVISKDSLHHFSNAKACIKEMFRVLKQNGVLYIQDLRRDLPRTLLKQAIPPDTAIKKLQYYSARASYTKDEIKGILKDIGLKQYRIYTRQASQPMTEKYKRMHIEPSRLKQSFISRYVIVAKNK